MPPNVLPPSAVIRRWFRASSPVVHPLLRSSEGLEDLRLPDLRTWISVGPTWRRFVGIAAGGTTPYVLGPRHARDIALGIAMACVPSDQHLVCDIDIRLRGPELLTGPPRAGTATKMALTSSPPPSWFGWARCSAIAWWMCPPATATSGSLPANPAGPAAVERAWSCLLDEADDPKLALLIAAGDLHQPVAARSFAEAQWSACSVGQSGSQPGSILKEGSPVGTSEQVQSLAGLIRHMLGGRD